MITRKLWRLLANPPQSNALYRRLSASGSVRPKRRQKTSLLGLIYGSFAIMLRNVVLLGVVYIGFLIVLLSVVVAANATPTGTDTGMGLLFLLISAIIFSGIIYGTDWTIAIADALTHERERGTYDLLSLCPAGPLGANWSISLGLLHRDNLFTQRYNRHLLVIRLLLIFAGVTTLSVIFAANSAFTFAENLVIILSLLAFIAAAYLDYPQSIITATLIGMFTALYAPRRSDAQAVAVIGFVGAQIGIYLTVVVVNFSVLPTIVSAFAVESATGELLLLIPRLLVFFLTREAVIVLLWQALNNLLVSDASEVERLFDPGGLASGF
ncbi:MAG: hypothetical protein GYB67_00875 [Chloroflexi bacterium]|nr:hypothetical protein [Chloroflexota bacterium]